MNLKEWKQQGKYLTYKNNQVFYRENGNGEHLLLIHGFPTASYDWHKIWDELIARFHVIAPDMMGFGFTDKPQNYKYSLFDQADLYEHILKEKGITNFHILAHDYGDTVAQELIARQLERQKKGTATWEIESVCFMNGGIIPGEHRPRLIQWLLMTPIGKWVGMLSTKSTLRKNFHAIFGKNTPPTEQEIDEFWELMTYNNGKGVIHKIIWYMDERIKNKVRWVGGMQNAIIPMLIINGPEDPISGRHSAEMFKILVPHAELRLLEGIGHYPQVEDPWGVLEQFINVLHA